MGFPVAVKIAFWTTALLLSSAAAAWLAWNLRRLSRPSVSGAVSNLSALRSLYRELEADARSGALSTGDLERSRDELAARIMAESGTEQPAAQAASTRSLTLAIVLCLPLASLGLYYKLGAPETLHGSADTPAAAAGGAHGELRDLTQRLAGRLRTSGGSADEWALLARSYAAMNDYGKALESFDKALAMTGDDADLLADYADATAMTQERRFEGKPRELIGRALKADPDHPKALWLAASMALEDRDLRTALGHFRRLEGAAASDPELREGARNAVAEIESRLGRSPSATTGASGGAARVIDGSVALGVQVSRHAPSAGTLFVFARAPGGARMPVAIARIAQPRFPATFRLDDASAMIPTRTLSHFKEVEVVARLSAGGGADPRPGDLESAPVIVQPGQGALRLELSRLLP